MFADPGHESERTLETAGIQVDWNFTSHVNIFILNFAADLHPEDRTLKQLPAIIRWQQLGRSDHHRYRPTHLDRLGIAV